MRLRLAKQNFLPKHQVQSEKCLKDIEKSMLREKSSKLFQNEVLYDSTRFSFQTYTKRFRNQGKCHHFYNLKANQRPYRFQKILPIQRKFGTKQNQKIIYLIPAEIFTILSPLFCDGLGQYLKKHQKYEQQKLSYFKYSSQKDKQLVNNSLISRSVVQNIAFQSELEEQFLTYFIKKYKDEESIKQFLGSILRLNYFSIADIAKDPLIRSLTAEHKKGKYSSFFELYKDGSDQLKNKLISKIIGSESQFGRYCRFLECHTVYTPFCIRHQNNKVAMLYTIRLEPSYFEKKIKNRQLLGKIRTYNIQEVVYVSGLYVLPKYKGMGHGQSILDILKRQGDVIVLCSSASSEKSGLEDNLCTGTFYKKCQFTEYYPVQTSQKEESDQGCLLQQGEEHNQCQPHRCMHPLQYYQDESLYVFDPLGRL